MFDFIEFCSTNLLNKKHYHLSSSMLLVIYFIYFSFLHAVGYVRVKTLTGYRISQKKRNVQNYVSQRFTLNIIKEGTMTEKKKIVQ